MDQYPTPVDSQLPERREWARREELIARIAAEYREMAGLSLTQAQARRLFGIEGELFVRILNELVRRAIVKVNTDGLLVRVEDDTY